MELQTIHAVYAGGPLHPRELLPFREGEEVTLAVVSEREQVRAALAHLLVSRSPLPDETELIDEDAALAHLDRVTAGLPPLSEILIEERRNGP